MTISRFSFMAGALATSLLFAGSASAQETVKIGAAVSLTGSFSREGNLLKNGYAYWERLVNEAGGINVAGKKTKVEVIYYDDESKPQSSARLTEKLITEDNVKFILGPYSSGIATATAAISEKYKVVTMTPMATADSLYQRGYKFIFCPSPLASTTLDPMLELIKKLPNPPILSFQWGSNKVLADFRGYLKSVSAKYTLFRADGVPLRATASISLEEVPQEPSGTNPTSGSLNSRRSQLISDGESLQSVAYREYGDPSLWRGLAVFNQIDDPLRIRAGSRILIPTPSEAAYLAAVAGDG